MTEPLVDDEARSVITELGLHRTLFVEAGAGTGKTHALVRRVVNLVLDRDVPLSAVAAITFTEAAATELASRIREAFEAEAEAATDPDRRARAEAALAETDRAAITTLHGFAVRLLQEFWLDAGLPPRVGVLDEISSELAREQRWERFADELYADPEHEALLLRAAALDIPVEPGSRRRASCKDLARTLADSWDRIEGMVNDRPPPLGRIDPAPLAAAVTRAEAMLGECSDHDDLFYGHLAGRVLPEARALLALEGDALLEALAPGVSWGRGSGGRKGSWSDLASAKACVDDLNRACDALRSAAQEPVLRGLLVLIAREVLAAAEQRRQEGTLEFHDMLVLARRLLRRSPRARAALHDRYRQLLLDEFQDTDPLQIELATLIAAAVEGEEPPEQWAACTVEDGRLFFVGDPKQAIYRFRRADIRLFLQARDRFGVGEDLQRLTTNFRTVAPVVEWVNELFTELMPEEIPGSQPRYEPLTASRQPGQDADHRPLLLGGPHEGVKADELRELEAADVAAVVAEVRDHPERWPVHDAVEGWRAPRLADVTILVPTRTSLPQLRAALDRSGLPYRLDSGTLVYDTQEIRDLLAVVRAVDDVTDPRPLVAALRSPLYACTDADLLTYRQAGGRWELHREPPDAVPADHPVRLALDHLRGLWLERRWLTPSQLLARVVSEREAFLLAFGTGRPAEVWRRLRFLVDQARAFEEAGGGDLRAFVAWADLQGVDSARVHEPLLPETDEDAVRIMTIHGAKGLEFPITILSGMTTLPGGGRGGVALVWNDDGRPEVRFRKGQATVDFDLRADLEAEMDAHEKLRLLYVACTRARDHLVVSCHHKAGESKRSFAAQVHERCAERDRDPRRLFDGAAVEASPPAPAPAEPATPEAPDARDRWIDARRQLLEPQRTPRVTSATAIAHEVIDVPEPPDEPDETALAPDAETVDDDRRGVVVRRRGRAGTAIGRAVHATLQMVDLADPQGLDAIAAAEATGEALPEAADTVAALARAALASDAVALAVAHRHHKELYVSAPVGDRVLEGYVDLLVDTPDGLVVVDYKTDTVADEAAVDAKLATYELQGAAYAVALEQVTGRPVMGCRFVFCTTDGPIEREVAELPAAMARVRERLAVGTTAPSP